MLISAQWAAGKYCWIAIRILRGIYLSVCLRKIRSSNGVGVLKLDSETQDSGSNPGVDFFFQYLLFTTMFNAISEKDLEFWHEIKSSRFSEKLSAKWAELNFDLFRPLNLS